MVSRREYIHRLLRMKVGIMELTPHNARISPLHVTWRKSKYADIKRQVNTDLTHAVPLCVASAVSHCIRYSGWKLKDLENHWLVPDSSSAKFLGKKGRSKSLSLVTCEWQWLLICHALSTIIIIEKNVYAQYRDNQTKNTWYMHKV